MDYTTEAARCDRRAEHYLARAASASSRVARIANLNLAAIFATRSEHLRWVEAR